MAVFKCKMCGGSLEIHEGQSVATCEYCGTEQTLPKLDSDRKANLYDRANHFRRNNDYDKAMSIYEQILNEDNTDAEAYWSLVLCKYGIEYVDDPATHKRVPTVNRAQYTSIYADEDYKSALEYADFTQKSVYEQEAKAIDEIQKGILAISEKEEPFDVFICYKETDNNGRRTPDSVLANDLYHQLVQEGFKVFFSRITLEDKLGSAYEPYIFAALNSAKVMVVLGTKPEYFNAVWVKNEWSRYLALIRNGSKKMLVPAYRDMDPYDLPDEFSHLQAQDMSKLGFMQDLIRGIKKIISADAPKAAGKETVVVNANSASTAPLLERVFLFLEDGKWQDANIYCEKVLDIEPRNAEAYLGKLMSELQVRNRKQLADCAEPFDDRDNYSKVLRFGDVILEAEMRGYITHINERNENIRLTGIYNNAKKAMSAANTEEAYKKAADIFSTIPGFEDADMLRQQCLEKAEVCRKNAIYASAKSSMIGEKVVAYENAIKIFQTIPSWKDADEQIYVCQKKIEEIKAKEEADRLEAECRRKDAIYDSAKSSMTGDKVEAYETAIKTFQTIPGWKDADKLIYACREKIEEIKAKEEADRLEAARKAEEHRIAAEKAAKKRKKIIAITLPIACACIAFIIVLTMVIIPNSKYNSAVSLMNEKKYEEAITAFEALNGYKDSENQIESCYIGKIGEEKWNRINNIKIGDTYTFGAYEQDNNTSNGKEAIEWTVLDKDGMSLLLLSKQALDCQQYNTSDTDVTWETCSLRKWMNGTFLNNAFSAEEQALIQCTTVSADINPDYSTNAGSATTDKVFLLSITEAEKYFTSDEARMCVPTAYAKAQGANTSDIYEIASGEAVCWWWLRSPGSNQYYAAAVDDDGSVYCDHNVISSLGCDRPALWINLGF